MLVSCFIMAKKYKASQYTKYYFAMLIMSLVALSLSYKNHGHYYESLVPFFLPFALLVASKIKPSWYKVAGVLLIVMTIALGTKIPESIRKNPARRMQIEEIVKRNEPYYSENEVVLVTGNNAVFYNALGVIPQEKYFYILNNKYSVFPEPRDAQAASILSGVNDVIIAVLPEGESEIYPETGKGLAIRDFLDRNYDVLLHDGNITMYGKKRN